LNRKIYSILALMIIVGIFGAWYFYGQMVQTSRPQTIRDDFENGFGKWIADSDVPLDPNNPGYSVEWRIERVTNVSISGQYSLKFFIDGRQDDGTIWIERRISAQKNSDIQVKVSFVFYSETESFNTIAVVCAYAGVRNPEAEADFTIVGPANEVAGWKDYVYTATVQTGSSEEIWVALGISVRWETRMAYNIDDVDIEIK